MTFDTGWTESSIIGLQKHHTHNVIANVTLPLQLLGIVLLVGKQCGYMEHDLDVTPICINGKETYKYLKYIYIFL